MRIGVAILSAYLVCGCGGGGENAPTPVASSKPTPTSTPTSTPTATPTVAPTQTPGTPQPSCRDAASPAPGGATYASCNFAVAGSSVTGTGMTATGSSDHFFAAQGATFSVLVAKGAQLVAYCDNTTSATASSCSAPGSTLVAMGSGSFTNYGNLQSLPSEAKPGPSYALTGNVVTIDNASAQPTSVTNYGTIGSDSLQKCSFCGPPGYYGQGDAAALLITGKAAVVNEPGGYLSGYNAFFTTSGTGTFDNYGVVFGVNDGLLTGYAVINHTGAGIVTGVAGFANLHNYGSVTNAGYILGADYALLAQNANGTIDDIGGAAVAGVTDFEGHTVYGGEISAIPRGSTTPNPVPSPGSPQLSGAAIEVVAPHVSITLHDSIAAGSVYLPLVLGPIDGGFNGSFVGASESIPGATLDFDFPDLDAADASRFRTAISGSKHTNSKGTFYTGSFSIEHDGVTYPYEWSNVPVVEFDGAIVSP